MSNETLKYIQYTESIISQIIMISDEDFIIYVCLSELVRTLKINKKIFSILFYQLMKS